jgi:hypothetical protein
VTFTSKLLGCHYVVEPSVPGIVTFTLTVTSGGLLHVVWTTTPLLQGTATVVCPDPDASTSIPGQTGPNLVAPTPIEFDLPVDGGRQPVGGGFQSGGDGWVHSGTITITRRPPT